MKKYFVSICLVLGMSVFLGICSTGAESGLPGSVVDCKDVDQVVAGMKGYCTANQACTGFGGSCSNLVDDVTGIITCANSGPCGSCTGDVNKTCKGNAESPYTCIDVLFSNSCCTPPNSCQTLPKSLQNPKGACSCSGPAPTNKVGTRHSC